MSSLEMQMQLAKSNKLEDNLKLANRSDLLPEVVDYLVDTDKFWIAFNTIEHNNPNVWPESLKKATECVTDDIFLFTVLVHLNTPVEILESPEWLANEYAILAVASNPNTPMDWLDFLADDESFELQKAVYTNPNTPKETKKRIKSQHPWYAFIGKKSYYKLKKIKVVASGN